MNASQWLEVLCSYSVQVVLVVTVAYLLDRHTRDSRTRSSIWSTFFWSVLALGCLAVVLPRLHLIRPWSNLRPESVLSIAESEVFLGKLLLPIWCLGAAVALLRWIRRGYVLHRMLGRCDTLSAAETQRLLEAFESTGFDSAKLCILVSDEIDGPFCWQFHRPTIVLPRFLLEGSDEDLSHVMVHELEHLKTQHPLQLFLQHAVQVICWFHPAVWRAARHVSLVRELACDDAAVAMGANTVAYLRTLLRIAERSETNKVTLGFGRNRSEIVVRSRRLVKLAQETVIPHRRTVPRFASITVLLAATVASQIWLPIDVMASSRSTWSPWPTWSAKTLHSFGVTARDYEQFDDRITIQELREDLEESETSLPRF